MRYLVVWPTPSKIHAVKAVRELLHCGLAEALRVVEQPPFELPDSVTYAQVEAAFGRSPAIDYSIIEGRPKRMSRCCICDTEKVRHWVDYDLFADPDDAEHYGGQPMCERCWREAPFEVLLSKLSPRTVWERLLDEETPDDSEIHADS